MLSPGVLLSRLRVECPLVHCITNYVAMNVAANATLAIGASPAMAHALEEVQELVRVARAVTINIGTLSPAWVEGMTSAAAEASRIGTPWVFDPVAHFISALRRRAAEELLLHRPTIIRGNASEIRALAREASHGHGVDAGDLPEHALIAARLVAHEYKTTVAISGVYDIVTDGKREVRVKGGSAFMPKVTALGCAQSACVGAFVAVAPEDPFSAAIAAMASFAVAGYEAEKVSKGPGSFLPAFLDALYHLDPNALESSLEMSST